MISRRAETVPTEYILEKDYTVDLDENGLYDAVKEIFDNGEYIVKNAVAAQKEAKHYAGTNVGVLALNSNLAINRWKVFRGFNVKEDPEIQTICGEMKAYGNSMTSGYTQYDALFVAGPSDPNRIAHINEFSAPTVHPCFRCRPKLEPETVVITFAAEAGVLEAHTGQEIHNLYGSFTNFKKQNAKVKRRSQFEYQDYSIDVPDTAGWAGMLATYNELVSNIDPESVENIRLTRAEIAVAAITHKEFDLTALKAS